jgi:hypothetical protein
MLTVKFSVYEIFADIKVVIRSCVMFCGSMLVFLSLFIFMWTLCCLSVDLWLLIIRVFKHYVFYNYYKNTYNKYQNVFPLFQTLEALKKNLTAVRTFKRNTP